MSSMAEHLDSFRAAMAEHGISFRGEINPDGKIHRVHCDGDSKGTRNGWYVFHGDENPAGVFGCHKRLGGGKINWSSKGSRPLTPEEWAAFKKKIEEDRRRREEEDAKVRAKAAETANALWERAKDVGENHPYLKRKGVISYGLRVGDWVREWVDPHTGEVKTTRVPNALLVPIRNEKKQIVSLQAIFESKKNALSRDKDFLTGGEKRGCWFAIGKPTQIDGKTVVVICEGYATGASIHIATELGVVIAFDAGNLLPVAETVRNLMKDSVIIIAADDDQWTEQPIKNPGVTRAREAADKIGGLVAKPLFKSLDGKPTDFNDLHTRDGSEMVKAQILAVLKPAPKVEPAPKPAGLPKAEKVKPDLTKSDEPKPGSDKADIPSNVDPSRHFTILGYDREHIYVYQHKKKMITARGEAAWDKKALISIADLSWWELNFHGDKGLNIDMAMNWLVRKAQDKGYYDPSLTRGRGAWEDEKRDIYHFGNMLWVNNVATPVEKIESKYVYEQSRHLLAPHDVALTNEEGKRIVELAKRFRWGRNASAVLLAGWCALAPICGALRWRPHIWITGGPGSGKSTILEHFVYLLTNGIALYAQGNSTEAGLRQILKTDALPVIFDEAEQNNDKERARMQGAISLIRQSSSESGAKTFKGTTHGQAMDFMIRSSFCLASIQVGIEHQADQERIAVLRLRPKRDADDAAGEWIKLRDDLHGMRRDRAMAAKLLRRALELRQITLRNVEVFATAAAGRFGSQRHGDQYGTLMAGAWSLVSEKLVTAVEAERVIDQYEWKEYLESSETEASEKALDVLRTAHISLPHGRTITVFDLVCLAAGRQSLGSHAPDSHEANEALSLYGLRVHAWNKTPEGLKKDLVDKLRKRNVVFHPTNLDFIALFKSSPFATNPASCLRDVSFSSGKANARIGGASKPCYCIPLDKFLGEDDVSNKSDVATDVAKQRDWGELEDAY